MELDFVAPGWQEPPEELKVSPEATGSSEVERECIPFVKRGVGKKISYDSSASDKSLCSGVSKMQGV